MVLFINLWPYSWFINIHNIILLHVINIKHYDSRFLNCGWKFHLELHAWAFCIVILAPCCTKNFMHSCSAVLAILKYNAYAHLYTVVLLRVYTTNHHISSWDEVTYLLVMPVMCYSYNIYIYTKCWKWILWLGLILLF
jgi:hypothetical protein